MNSNSSLEGSNIIRLQQGVRKKKPTIKERREVLALSRGTSLTNSVPTILIMMNGGIRNHEWEKKLIPKED